MHHLSQPTGRAKSQPTGPRGHTDSREGHGVGDVMPLRGVDGATGMARGAAAPAVPCLSVCLSVSQTLARLPLRSRGA